MQASTYFTKVHSFQIRETLEILDKEDDDDDGYLLPWWKVQKRQKGSYLDGGHNISSRTSLDGRQMQNISVRIQEIPEDVFVNVFLQEIQR